MRFTRMLRGMTRPLAAALLLAAACSNEGPSNGLPTDNRPMPQPVEAVQQALSAAPKKAPAPRRLSALEEKAFKDKLRAQAMRDIAQTEAADRAELDATLRGAK